jgi:hypothetical protein
MDVCIRMFADVRWVGFLHPVNIPNLNNVHNFLNDLLEVKQPHAVIVMLSSFLNVVCNCRRRVVLRPEREAEVRPSVDPPEHLVEAGPTEALPGVSTTKLFFPRH